MPPENPMVVDSLWNDSEQKKIGNDSLGNEIRNGDAIYEYEGETFVVEELSYDTIHVLELIGATRKTA